MRHLLRDTSGAAAVEMAMVVPLLLLLMFGSLEMGNFIYSQHRLTESVRDGARFAARQDLTKYPCAGSIDATVAARTQQVVRTGVPSGGADLLPRWGEAGAGVAVSYSCVTATSDGTTLDGIYRSNPGGAPVVNISARVPYGSLVGGILGMNFYTLWLNADHQAAVVGL